MTASSHEQDASSHPSSLLVERRGHVLIVQINRPEVRNAIDSATSVELHRVWQEFKDDPDLWVGVLTGTGDHAFSAGADLKAHAKTGLSNYMDRIRVPFGGITAEFDCSKPLIAAINGIALGGGFELALTCDLRIAAPHAEFGLPEVRWGVIAAGGGLVRLPRLIPMTRAMEMVLMARRISAAEALELGLLNAVVPSEQLLPTAIEWAETICEMGPLAVRASKDLMLRARDVPVQEGLTLDDEVLRQLAQTEDAAEGPRAFAEKRKPVFQGR